MARPSPFIDAHPVLTYCAITFAISWGGALVVLGPGSMSGAGPTTDPKFVYAVVAMLAGPSVAGMLLTVLLDGRKGLAEFISRLVRWRVSPKWYVLAVLTAPALWLATMMALLQVSSRFWPGLATSADPWMHVQVGLAVALAAGVFEELGWTGFLIPHLRRHLGSLATGVAAGMIWGTWHWLTNVWWASPALSGELPLSIFLPASTLSMVMGNLAAFRVLMVWLYERTHSLLLGVVMHISLTASVLILDPVGLSGAAMLTYALALAATSWAVVAAVAVLSGAHERFPAQAK